MKYAQIGKSGPVVSRLALGAMTFGAETDKQESLKQMDLFLEAGGTMIDTANNYGGGLSEEYIGEWLTSRKINDEVIIATKGRFDPPKGSHGTSRRGLKYTVERSLKRLKRDAIDLFYVHGWDEHTPVEETLDTLGDLVKSGKIHNIGWSNVTGWQLQKIVSTAQFNRFPKPVVFQPQYNLLDRAIELELLP